MNLLFFCCYSYRP